MTTLGYVGLGNMGCALARRLCIDHPLAAYDRNPATFANLTSNNVTRAASLKDVASAARTIFLCLPRTGNVREAILGPEGLAEHAAPGTVFIDQTTGDPAQTAELARDLAARGFRYVDAPVSGGPKGADAGTIAIMVGASDADFAEVEPILKAISPNVFRAGEVTAGQVIKLANNLLAAGLRLLSMEAMSLALKGGVAPDNAASIIRASSGNNFYHQHFMSSHIISGKLTSGFTLDLLDKDVTLACDLGEHTMTPLLLGNTIKEVYRMAINRMGRQQQVNSVALLFNELTGSGLVPDGHDLEAALAAKG